MSMLLSQLIPPSPFQSSKLVHLTFVSASSCEDKSTTWCDKEQRPWRYFLSLLCFQTSGLQFLSMYPSFLFVYDEFLVMWAEIPSLFQATPGVLAQEGKHSPSSSSGSRYNCLDQPNGTAIHSWLIVSKSGLDEMFGCHHWLYGHEFEQTLGGSEGQRSLSCCSPRGCKEWNMT